MDVVTDINKPRKGLFLQEMCMSWFRRRPRVKEPNKSHPYRSSPVSDRILKDVKDEVRKPSDLSSKVVNKD